MRRFLLIVVSILISVIFLFLVLRGQPLEEIWMHMRQANVFWLLLAFASVLLALWTRAIRWRGLLPGNPLTTMEAFYILGVTFTLNMLPLRAGEVARSVLATRHGVPFMTAATSVVLERLVDTLLVVVLLLVALSKVPSIPPEVARAMSIFGVLAIIGFGVMVVFARYKQFPRRILAGVLNVLPFLKRLPLERLLEHVLDGLEPLTHWRLFVHTLLWTLISWSISLVTLWMLHLSLNITDINLLLSSTLGITLASLGAAVPVTVGSLGPFEAMMAVSGQLAGLDNVRAVSLGFVFHGISVLGYLVLGAVSFARLRINAGELMSNLFKDKPGDDDPQQS